MGRPRKYATDAERQRACRPRREGSTLRVERRALEGLYGRLEQLQEAIREAAAAGNETARACQAASVETMLEKMIRAFGGTGNGGAVSASRGAFPPSIERGGKKTSDL